MDMNMTDDLCKVYYDHTTKDIVRHTSDLADTLSPGVPFVLARPSQLVTTFTPLADGSDSPLLEKILSFPLNDIVMLKTIAAQTIDFWRLQNQASGYTHTATGVSYGTDERVRALVIGKIQEMQLLGSTSTIFPDSTGTPVTHTLAEMTAVGLGIAAKIEADYVAAVALTGQVMAPTVTTLPDIEAILAPVLGAM